MKKYYIHSLLFLIGVNVSAHDIEVPNADGVTIYYNYINNSTELAVTFAGDWYGHYNNEYSGVVVIPEEVTLEERTLKVTRIENSTFSGCYELISMTIPNSVTSIGDYAFEGCRSLTSVIIPDGITSIGKYTFDGCSNLTSVTIPNGVTSIGEYAFEGCSALTSISLPNNMATIGVGAFEYCNGLTSIDIPNSVMSIEDNTFAGCKNLTIISIGNSVACIGNNAFAGCRSLTSVIIPNSVTSIGEYAFYECYGLTSIDIGNGVTSIGNDAFWGCTSLSSITIGNSVTSIGESAFYGCSCLKSITIPPSVTHIGNSVFFNCYELNAVHISDLEAWCNIQFDDVFFSRYHLYLNGKEITNLIIPESVTTVGNYAFAKCYRLVSITIPNGITSIGDYAFYGCSNLQNVYCQAEQGPRTGDSVFEYSNFDATLHVPASSVSAYQATEPWKNFKKIVALPDQYDYRPFVEEGKVWKVGDLTSGNPVQWVDYYFDGDTIIDGKTCKQMMCQQYVNPEDPDYAIVMQYPLLQYVGAWYEEDKKVYFYNANNKQMRLMYDFSLDDNGLFHFFDFQYVVGPKQTGGINGFKGVYREVWECGDGGNTFQCAPWMEGVGLVYGPPTTNVFNVELADPAWYLMSCTVGDEVIYYNSEEEDPYAMGARKRRIDFTHTIKIQPKARIKQEESDACINSSERDVARPKVKSRTRSGAEESMYGEYNDQQLCINLDPLDDAYQVRITSESGKAVYEKDINAGNIVGLNIDISTYAKGHYTVTVENSGESFTGEFGAGNADAIGDGEVNVADVDFVIEHIGEAFDEKNKAADVNDDGEINVADVDYIIERIK